MSTRLHALVLLAAAVLTPQDKPPPRALLPWWDRAEEAQVGHYWIKTDLPADHANALARHLNVMYAEYSRRLASLPQRGPQRLNVMIFERRRDYLMELRTRFGVEAEGTGGIFFVTPQGTGLAFWIENLPARRVEHVLQHEGFHQFAFSRFGSDLPVWVNEGLAEFFGEAVLIGDRLFIGQSTPRVITRIRDAVENETYLPFERMLSLSSQEWQRALGDGSAALQYNQAWSMVHFLVYGDDGRYTAAFEQYLHLVNAGVLSNDAFVRAFGPDIKAFEGRWKAAASAARPSALRTAMERLEVLAEGALELSRRRIVPASLDELARELQAIGFTYTMQQHGWDEVARADDAALYTIPIDERSTEQPVFEVEPIDLERLSHRDRLRQQEQPLPPVIRTQNLEPRELEVRWRRDRETGETRYEIGVGKGLKKN